MRLQLFAWCVFVISGCKAPSPPELSHSEMIRIVKELDNQFSVGVKRKDSVYLANIYSDSARYVQPNRGILNGKPGILRDWAGFVTMKQNPVDLVLVINSVGGTRDVIYETGWGYTLLADSARWKFNYVNVWRLEGGQYKLAIDTYTPLD